MGLISHIRITTNQTHLLVNVDDETYVNEPHEIEYNFDSLIYLGGVPIYESFMSFAKVLQGLRGTIQKFSINNNDLVGSNRLLVETKNIKEASACSNNTCSHNSICTMFYNQTVCQCSDGFYGKNCLLEIDNFRLNFKKATTNRCQLDEVIKTLSFELRIANTSGRLLEVSFPHEGDMDLLANLALDVVASKVRARVEFAAFNRTVELFSADSISTDQWNFIKFELWNDLVMMYVNQFPPTFITLTNPLQNRKLNLRGTLTIGGSSGGDDESSTDVDFYGDIRQLKVGMMSVVSLSNSDGNDDDNSNHIPPCFS